MVRRIPGLLLGILTVLPLDAAAQHVVGEAEVRVTLADGTEPFGALVELSSDTGARTVRAVVASASTRVTLPVADRTARVRVSFQGFQPAECVVSVDAGEVVSVDARLTRVGEAAVSTTVIRDRLAVSRQTAFDRRAIDTLPTSSAASALLETTHPFLISDRIDGGGQWPGDSARVGGQQGSSASQVTYRIGGLDVTDPQLFGEPMADPSLAALDTIVVQTAALEPASAGPGPVVDLVVRRPSTTWTGEARVALAPPGLQHAGGDTPPISRLRSGGDGSMSAGGPVASGVGLFVSGRLARAERIDRNAETTTPWLASTLAHLVATPRDSEIRAVVSFDDARRPFAARARFAQPDLTERADGFLMHAGWERLTGGSLWSAGGGVQRATTEAGIHSDVAGAVIERLRDGPPLALVTGARASTTRWTLQGGLAPTPRRWLGRDHVIRVGASIGGASRVSHVGPQPAFGELIDGQPARVWDVTFRGDESRHSSVSASAFVSDRIALADRVTLMGSMRAEFDHGSAAGSSSRIRWFSATPRATLRWRPGDSVVVTTGYALYGHRLPLSYLDVGDPAGPAGVMSRWDDRNGDRQFTATELTPVAAVGACCTSAGPSRIADLRRPVTGEFLIGMEHAMGAWRWSVTGIDRRERHQVALVNDGLTSADYTVSFIDDPGVDIAGLSGFERLPIYDRTAASFLKDAYLLTNTPADPSRYQGLEVALSRDLGDRWLFRFGGSAYRSEGVGANRGYRVDENDQGPLGEVFTTPNAATNARGRLFYDRAFVMKVLGAYRGAGPLGAAVVARYQDGQPFARLVVANGLAQGAEIIQAYPRGGQRFTYTLTLDARVDLRWKFGSGRSLGLAFEAFNLPNMQLEVEEDIVTGPAFRAVTAVQPPRVLRIGLEVGF